MSSDSDNQRPPPKCSRCQNHGKNYDIKNHKRFCENKDCVCKKCIETEKRQKRNAQRIATSRAQDQDANRNNVSQSTDHLPETMLSPSTAPTFTISFESPTNILSDSPSSSAGDSSNTFTRNTQQATTLYIYKTSTSTSPEMLHTPHAGIYQQASTSQQSNSENLLATVGK